jgi:hypothetical protein
MRSLHGFNSESNANAESLDIHLHDSATRNTGWLKKLLDKNSKKMIIHEFSPIQQKSELAAFS